VYPEGEMPGNLPQRRITGGHAQEVMASSAPHPTTIPLAVCCTALRSQTESRLALTDAPKPRTG
jgi:hypothetical protein